VTSVGRQHTSSALWGHFKHKFFRSTYTHIILFFRLHCSIPRVRPCLRFLNTSSIHTYYIIGLSIRLTLVFGFNCCCVSAPNVSCDTAAQRCLAHVACDYSGVYVRTTSVCALYTEADASTNSMHNQRTAQRKPLWYMPIVTTVPGTCM
jgi:hypothetical protein